jgi:hypothetical protein
VTARIQNKGNNKGICCPLESRFMSRQNGHKAHLSPIYLIHNVESMVHDKPKVAANELHLTSSHYPNGNKAFKLRYYERSVLFC